MTQENINIAELLKDCPKGMELDCPLYENLYFECICEHKIYPIVCYTVDSKGEKNKTSFNWYGKHTPVDTAKCVIFPKGKTTWEGFQRPFKDGDIVTAESDSGLQMFILQTAKSDYSGHCYIGYDFNLNEFFDAGEWVFDRLATEEEKEKLFKAIKNNGYKWNAETKTLEKLNKPMWFKVGDKVRYKKNHDVVCTITSIIEDYYVCGAGKAIWFSERDDYELIPNKFDITTLIPFESRVLVRDDKYRKWLPAVWGGYDDNNCYPYEAVGGQSFRYCIPYEHNEHLRGKIDDCEEFYKTWE